MPIQDPELAGALRIGVAANGECGPATIRDGLTHCPLVNHDFVQSVYPPGNTSRFNEGIVYVDNYRRKQPLFGQFTVGFEREVLPTLSVGIDYVNIMGSQLLNRINYVAPYRDGIDSSDPVTFYDVYAARGGVYNRTDTGVLPELSAGGGRCRSVQQQSCDNRGAVREGGPGDGHRSADRLPDRRLEQPAAVDREHRVVALRRPEPLDGEALLGSLGHAAVVRARLLARRHLRAVRHQRHQPQRRPDPGPRRTQHGRQLAAG